MKVHDLDAVGFVLPERIAQYQLAENSLDNLLCFGYNITRIQISRKRCGCEVYCQKLRAGG
jgi:hypothetical protein